MLATPSNATAATAPANKGAPPGRTTFSPPNLGSWKYDGRPRPRLIVLVSVLVGVGVHVGVLFGFSPPAKKPVVVVADTLMSITLEPPPLEEPEPTEVVPAEDLGPPEDLGLEVPMQADLPQLPQPTDFVQQLDFASLTEQPDFSKAKVFSIPDNIRRGGKIGDGMGKIFDLKELDRQPIPIVQPSPVMPAALASEGLTGTVWVEFIVNVDGGVSQPTARDSTDHRFDDAAMRGVAKWKFKPGMKGGRKVNTRMLVPIVFNKPDAKSS